jgi:hypothetical protein
MTATERALQELIRERDQLNKAIHALQNIYSVSAPPDRSLMSMDARGVRVSAGVGPAKIRRTRAMNGRFGATRLGVMSFLSARTKPVTYAEIYDNVPRPDVYAKRRRKAWETVVRSSVNLCEHEGHIKVDRTAGRLQPKIEATNAGRAWFQKVSTK